MANSPAIPASYTAQVNPGVLSAGGTALDLIGLALTASTRPPIGTVLGFATQPAVAAYFGALSNEAQFASVYFLGYDNKTKTPDELLFAQYPTSAVAAYLRGASVAALTLAQLQAITGTVIVTIDGTVWTSSSISLSTATSFSSAAALIQTALGASDAAFTGSIGPATSSFTGVLASGVLTTTSVTGPIVPGAIVSGVGVTGSPTIVSQTGGTIGGAGTYQTSGTQTLSSVAMTTANAAAGVLTVASGLTGVVAVGQNVAGSTTLAGTVITALLSGTGGTGTYIVTPSQTVTSASLTSGNATVTYDSVSGAFVITAGTPGATGTITFATGTASTALMLTSATGAVTSQGAAPAVPASAMAAIVAATSNWATFGACGWEPATAVKVAFSAWCNSQNDRFAYPMADTDITVTTNSDTSSAGYQIIAANYSGTMPIYHPSGANYFHAAFVMGAIASIDFTRTNGRRNLKFMSQTGLVPGVTSEDIAKQLTLNGYNYYGANANATNAWNFYAEGTVTGPFKWGDSYVNQIWFNSQCQTALMTLQTSIGSVPFNSAGQILIDTTLADPIDAALNFGAIRPNVPLSALQAAEVNAATGLQIDGVLSSRGWYIFTPIPSAASRAARVWDNAALFYTDGGSVNRINLASILVQ